MGRQHSLKTWRKTKGLSQRDVASMLDIHVMYISMIERGARRPGMGVATKIRDLTEGSVTLDELAGPAARAAH